MLRLMIVTVAVLAVTGVSAAQTPAEDAPPARRIATPTPPRLTCGRLPFAPEALRRRTGYERRAGAKAQALRRFLRESAWEVGQSPRGWLLLAYDDKTFEVVNPDGRRSYGHMTFERERGRWSWAGSGGCVPVAYDDGRGASSWRRRHPRAPLPPETTRIPIWVHPDFCNSGRDASGLILSPLVHYGPREVTVTYFVLEPDGAQTCQGTPPTRVVLVLDEPLGGRRLRDGGAYPPRVRH